MSAEVIDLPRGRNRPKPLQEEANREPQDVRKRIRELMAEHRAPIEEKSEWEGKWEAHRKLREQRLELLAEHHARPKITIDDPIFALWDACKEAKAKYDVALLELAHQWGVPIINAAAVLRSVRQHHKAKVRANLYDLPDGVFPI